MTTVKRLRQSVRRCMRAGVKHGDGANIIRMCGMSTTGRIHILVSHATLYCLQDYAAQSPRLVLRAWRVYSRNTVCSRNLKSLLTFHASHPSTMDVYYGQQVHSQLPCGIQKYVCYSGMVLHFVCAEHGCINVNQL